MYHASDWFFIITSVMLILDGLLHLYDSYKPNRKHRNRLSKPGRRGMLSSVAKRLIGLSLLEHCRHSKKTSMH